MSNKSKNNGKQLSKGAKAFLLTLTGCLILGICVTVAYFCLFSTTYVVNQVQKAVDQSSVSWDKSILTVTIPNDKGTEYDWDLDANSHMVSVKDIQYLAPDNCESCNSDLFGHKKYVIDINGCSNPTLTFNFRNTNTNQVAWSFCCNVTSDESGNVTHCQLVKE